MNKDLTLTLKEHIKHQLACNYPRKEAIKRAIAAFKLQRLYNELERKEK